MKKLPFAAVALMLAIGCSHKTDNPSEADTLPGTDRFSGQYEEVITEEISSNRRETGKPWTNHIGRYDEIFNDSNYLQYQSAERLGIDPIFTLADAYNTRRPLIKIESGDLYEVDELTHSMPYLVPEAARLLDEIGEEFGNTLLQRGGDPEANRIIVTSVLRSPYTVRKLRRVNRNAVDSSTHMFGTTFDIAWNHFHYPDSSRSVDAVVLKGILAEVLKKKRDEGKCLVKFEKKSPCFHITVNK